MSGGGAVLAGRLPEGLGRGRGVEHVVADLTRGRVHTTGAEEVDLCTLDGLIVKKISATYSPSTLDCLELLRVAGVDLESDEPYDSAFASFERSLDELERFLG